MNFVVCMNFLAESPIYTGFIAYFCGVVKCIVYDIYLYYNIKYKKIKKIYISNGKNGT